MRLLIDVKDSGGIFTAENTKTAEKNDIKKSMAIIDTGVTDCLF